jgi:hypothetical protein
LLSLFTADMMKAEDDPFRADGTARGAEES